MVGGRRDVQGQAGQEAGDHAGHRAAAEGQRDDHEQQQVGRDVPGQRQPVQHGELDDQGYQHQQG